jgi:hypothetical protein
LGLSRLPLFIVLLTRPLVKLVKPRLGQPVAILGPEVWCLCMAIRTDEPYIVRLVILRVSVYVVNLEYEGLTLPFRWASASLTAMEYA